MEHAAGVIEFVDFLQNLVLNMAQMSLNGDIKTQRIARKLSPAEARGLRAQKAGTLDDLAARFYKLHFPNIEENTRSDYRAAIEPLRTKHGSKRVAHLRVPHVMKINADMAATPQQANKTLKRLSQMLDLAVKLEWRTDDPITAVDRFKTSSAGYHTWDEGEMEKFYKMHPLGSPAHLAMTLML